MGFLLISDKRDGVAKYYALIFRLLSSTDFRLQDSHFCLLTSVLCHLPSVLDSHQRNLLALLPNFDSVFRQRFRQRASE